MNHGNLPRWLEIAWACAGILTSIGGFAMMLIWLHDRKELRKLVSLIEKMAGGPVKRPEKSVEIPSFEEDPLNVEGIIPRASETEDRRG